MLLDYTISATDLGSAIGIAERRARNDGFSHASIQSTRQTGPREWLIVVFGSNAQGVTARR